VIKSLLKYPRGYFLLPSSFDNEHLLLNLALNHGFNTPGAMVLMLRLYYSFILKLTYLENLLFSLSYQLACLLRNTACLLSKACRALLCIPHKYFLEI